MPPLYQRLSQLVDARARCLDNLRRLQPQVMDGSHSPECDAAMATSTRRVCDTNCGRDVTADHWREMANRHFDAAYQLVKSHMPSGAGWDNGTTFDMSESTPNHLRFHGAYHHMHESGMYDGWTDHEIHVRPSLQSPGFDLRISGPNRNDVKEYLYETFADALRTEVI